MSCVFLVLLRSVMSSFETNQLVEERILNWLWTFVSPVLLIVGSIGNVISLLVLVLTPSFRTGPAGFALSALSAVDTGVLITSLLPRWLSNAYNWDVATTSPTACPTHFFVSHLFTHLSSWTVAVLSVDRATSIGRPFARMRTVTYKARRRVVITWSIVCLVLASVNAHFYWTVRLVSAGSSANDVRKADSVTSASFAVDIRHLTTASEVAMVGSRRLTLTTGEAPLGSLSAKYSMVHVDATMEAPRTPPSAVEWSKRAGSHSERSDSQTAHVGYHRRATAQSLYFTNTASWLPSTSSSHNESTAASRPTAVTFGDNDGSRLNAAFDEDDDSSEFNDKYCLFSQSYSSFYKRIWYWIDVTVWAIVPFTVIVISNFIVISSISTSARNVTAVSQTQLHHHLPHPRYPRHRNVHQVHRQMAVRVTSLPTLNSIVSSTSSSLDASLGTDPLSSSLCGCRQMNLTSTGATLLCVSAVFLLTTSPMVVYMAIHASWLATAVSVEDIARIRLVHGLCSMIYYAGNASNFALYCLSGPRFRRAFVMLLSTISCRRKCWRCQCMTSSLADNDAGLRLRQRSVLNRTEMTSIRSHQNERTLV